MRFRKRIIPPLLKYFLYLMVFIALTYSITSSRSSMTYATVTSNNLHSLLHASPHFSVNSNRPSLPISIIVTQTNPDHFWCECSHPLLSAYVSAHPNYRLYWTTPDEMSTLEAMSSDPLSAKFLKYSNALKHFEDSSLVVIMDCDMFVTNMDIRIEGIWRGVATPLTDLVIARDAHWQLGVPINSGLIIARPSTFCWHLFSNLIENKRLDWKVHGNLFNAATLVDQPRLTYDLMRLGQLEKVPKEETEYHSHVSIVSQRVMNSFYRIPDSYWSGAHKDPAESKWREGDWVAHVTGMQKGPRVEAAKKFGGGCPGVVDNTHRIEITTDGVHAPK